MGNISVVTIDSLTVTGNKRIHIGTLHLSSSYASNGDSFTANQFGMTIIDSLAFNDGVLKLQADLANLKIKAIYPTGGAVAALPAAVGDPTVAPGGVAVTSTAGTGTLAPGEGREVKATTDLSGITIGFTAIGA